MGAAVDNGGGQMTQQRVAGKECSAGDGSEGLQTLVGLLGLSLLFLQNQELRRPILSCFHLLAGILVCLPT